MESLDLSKVFCIVEALNAEAENALKLPHNQRFRVLPAIEGAANKARGSRATTPAVQYPSQPRLAFSLNYQEYVNPRKGIAFGSDDQVCDVALASDNAGGISAIHFWLTWNWSEPHPLVLIVHNLSSNGTLVDHQFLAPTQRWMLYVQSSTIVKVGPLQLRFDIPSNRNETQETCFHQCWEDFSKSVRNAVPRIDALNIGNRFKPTPPFPHGQAAPLGAIPGLSSVLSPLVEEPREVSPKEGAPNERTLVSTEIDAEDVRQVDAQGSGDTYELEFAVLRQISKNIALIAEHESGRFVALKKLLRTDEKLKYIRAEIEIMKTVHHPNIVDFFGHYDLESETYIKMEYAAFGDMKAYMDSQPKSWFPSEQLRQTVAKQLIDATQYLHSLFIIHRDIKPENVLMCGRNPIKVKLADFGVSTMVSPLGTSLPDPRQMTFCGSLPYCAPEVFFSKTRRRSQRKPARQAYSFPADIWSLGATLFHFMVGEYPFPDGAKELSQVDFRRLKPHEKPHPAEALLRRMLQHMPEKRPTAERCKLDKWFTAEQVLQDEDINSNPVQDRFLAFGEFDLQDHFAMSDTSADTVLDEVIR